jgi:RimJ/RimL family protein N-acetyltransferase
MELRTDRLVLRPVVRSDAPQIHAYRGDPETARYLPGPPLDDRGTRRLVDEAVARWASRPVDGRYNLLFVVVLDQLVIGDLHAWNSRERHQPASADPAEVWIGYAFNPNYRGQGYATEAVRALINWVVDEQRARTVLANCFLDNERSLSLLRALGFTEHVRFSSAQDAIGKQLASVRMRLACS